MREGLRIAAHVIQVHGDGQKQFISSGYITNIPRVGEIMNTHKYVDGEPGYRDLISRNYRVLAVAYRFGVSDGKGESEGLEDLHDADIVTLEVTLINEQRLGKGHS